MEGGKQVHGGTSRYLYEDAHSCCRSTVSGRRRPPPSPPREVVSAQPCMCQFSVAVVNSPSESSLEEKRDSPGLQVPSRQQERKTTWESGSGEQEVGPDFKIWKRHF